MDGGRPDLDTVVRRVLHAAGVGADDRLVVGLSGGVDSQTLTHVLARLRAGGDGPELRLVHVDHRLRAGSAEDARQVERFARGLSLTVDVVRVDVEAWHAVQGQGIEAAARAARYAALARVAETWGASWIAVGHNLDDQAETVLLRLARGASLEGLAGMRSISSRVVPLEPGGMPRTSINLLRPLKSVRRSEIEAYAAGHQLVPVVDESNIDLRFRRNAVRHELVPALERIVSGASRAIARTAELLADDADLLSQLATAAFDACCRPQGSTLRLDRAAYRNQPRALQRRIVLLAVRAFSDELELTRERIEAVRAATLGGAVGSRIEIGRGIASLVDYDAVFIGPVDQLERELLRSRALPELEPGTIISLEHSMSIPAGSCWTIEIEQSEPTARWVLRTRLPGDLLLLSSGRHRRLQDWLVDRKVPVGARDRLPLLVHDGVVCWVAGVSAGTYEDVHSRLAARLVQQRGDMGRDGEHARGYRLTCRPEEYPDQRGDASGACGGTRS